MLWALYLFKFITMSFIILGPIDVSFLLKSCNSTKFQECRSGFCHLYTCIVNILYNIYMYQFLTADDLRLLGACTDNICCL